MDGDRSFNTKLADAAGADAYGMKRFCIVFLRKGPNRVKDGEEGAALQRRHLDELHHLQEQGLLLVAGPLLDDGDLRGILILDTDDTTRAEQAVLRDPAVRSGHLTAAIHPWYGSAALTQVPAIHSQLAEKKV